MKHIFSILPFFLFACSGAMDEETLARAVNDEALQELNQLFEAGNADFYAEVYKRRAAAQATKQRFPDMAIFSELERLFISTKQFIDSTQSSMNGTHCLVEFHPGELYCTTSLPELSNKVNFDLATLTDSIVTCLEYTTDLLRNDTTYRIFEGLDTSAFTQNRTYKFEDFNAELQQLITALKKYSSVETKSLQLIDVLEFLTLCRTTVLLAERKALRFHNETFLASSTWRLTDEIIPIVESDKIIYRPGERMKITPYAAFKFEMNYLYLNYAIDSGAVITRKLSADYHIDTLFIPTSETGHHTMQIESGNYRSKQKRYYHYFVMDK